MQFILFCFVTLNGDWLKQTSAILPKATISPQSRNTESTRLKTETEYNNFLLQTRKSDGQTNIQEIATKHPDSNPDDLATRDRLGNLWQGQTPTSKSSQEKSWFSWISDWTPSTDMTYQYRGSDISNPWDFFLFSATSGPSDLKFGPWIPEISSEYDHELTAPSLSWTTSAPTTDIISNSRLRIPQNQNDSILRQNKESESPHFLPPLDTTQTLSTDSLTSIMVIAETTTIAELPLPNTIKQTIPTSKPLKDGMDALVGTVTSGSTTTRGTRRSNIAMATFRGDHAISEADQKAGNKSIAFRKQFGEREDIILIGGNMVLVISAAVSNLIVLKYYRHQIKKLIPFLYFSVASADLITALSCSLHPAILFLLLYLPSLESTSSVFILISFLISSSSIRVGVFNTLVLSVVRSINIVQPFYQIKLGYLKLVTAIYPVTWVILGSLDIYGIVDLGYMANPKALFKHFIYKPMSGSGLATLLLGEDATYLQIILFGMTVPFLIPCLIVCVCLAFQIHYLNISTAHLKQGTKISSRRPAITIFQLTLLFVICNIAATIVFISYYVSSGSQTRRTDASDARIMYLSSCVLHVFNAAFSPLIMILRGRSLKTTITSELRSFRSRFSSRSSSVEPSRNSSGVKVTLYRY
ncbi:hypothetical protein ACHWQZ_G012591 [Mnemiopsis leidyi]